MTQILEVEGLSKTFGGVRAVSDVSFGVPAGAVFGLIGPNGAGKTSVVNLVTGYFAPSSGVVRYDGDTVQGMRPHRLAARGVARTFQSMQLFDDTTVLENVLIGRHLSFHGQRWQLWFKRRAEEKSQRKAAEALIDRVGLSSVKDEIVGSLPYGQRRRVEIARAMATEPRLLLLDEPTAGMTRRESDDVGHLIQSINADGVTIVLVDHNVRLVSEVCHRVAVMDWGALVMEASPEDVWKDERVREAYLGKGQLRAKGTSRRRRKIEAEAAAAEAAAAAVAADPLDEIAPIELDEAASSEPVEATAEADDA